MTVDQSGEVTVKSLNIPQDIFVLQAAWSPLWKVWALIMSSAHMRITITG